MKRMVWWLIVVFGVGVFSLIFYHAWQKKQPAPQPSAPAPTAPPAPSPPAEPAIRYPVPEAARKKPLPPLNESDTVIWAALSSLWNAGALDQFFHLKDFVRRVVATIDNLPRSKVALRLIPVKQAAGTILTTGRDAGLGVSPANAARYAAYVRLAEAVDTKRLAALYLDFYPLFQQAYQELGYPKGYFNDRLIEVIDHLLAAPEVRAPVKLTRPKVFYLFADPELEARSAGQKILMRIGNENAARLKSKLREIRSELTRHSPKE